VIADSTFKNLENVQDNNFHLVAGFAEQHKEKLYNSALVIGPSGLIATYRKLHLFNTEKEYFDPGNTPLGILDIDGGKIMVMICFDWAFPEVTRVLAQSDAETDEVVVQEIEPAAARNKSITSNNNLLSDRRSEFYTSIAHEQCG
jgi:predicted amidohydrolase